MDKEITCDECNRQFEENGMCVILNDGNVIGFENAEE